MAPQSFFFFLPSLLGFYPMHMHNIQVPSKRESNADLWSFLSIYLPYFVQSTLKMPGISASLNSILLIQQVCMLYLELPHLAPAPTEVQKSLETESQSNCRALLSFVFFQGSEPSVFCYPMYENHCHLYFFSFLPVYYRTIISIPIIQS